MSDLDRTRLRWFILALCGVGAAGAAVAAALFLGGFDSAATAAWSQPAAYVLHHTMIHSVKVRAGALQPPERFTPAQAQAGFRIYDTHCAMCHGGPGLGRQPWTAGMEPAPPYLVDAARHWRAQDLYWIVNRGIKMTGMPAWSLTLSSADTWNLVAFLEALPTLTPADYARLRATTPQGGPAPTQPERFGPVPPPPDVGGG